MTKSFVIVAADLIKEKGFDQEFRYRVFVNNELFAERTWIWDDGFYIEENLQIEAVPGEYPVHFEVHGARHDVLKIKNIRVVEGPGQMIKNKLVLG